MKQITGTLTILVILAGILGLPVSGIAALTGKVIKVIDGDSILVRNGDHSREIRLWGVDAPEYNQPYGLAAKSHCTRLLQGRSVKVEVKDRDKFGRLVGIVSVNGVNINELLIRSGSAWVYRRYCKSAICEKWKELEYEARRDRKGVWRNAEAVPPWKWRHASPAS